MGIAGAESTKEVGEFVLNKGRISAWKDEKVLEWMVRHNVNVGH